MLTAPTTKYALAPHRFQSSRSPQSTQVTRVSVIKRPSQHKGKKKISKRKFFPGYILLQMEVTDESWYFVTETNGVIGFAGEGRPVPLLEHEIEGKVALEAYRRT